jgi:copper chaperone CopZ
MKKLFGTIFLLIAINSYSQEQAVKTYSNNNFEFSSIEKTATNKFRLEVIFSNVSSKEDVNEIIRILQGIQEVESVEVFYPQTTRSIIMLSSKISSQVIIEKLNSINIQLDPKSLRKQD